AWYAFAKPHARRAITLGIDLDLKLSEIPAETLDGRDAWHGEQPILHVELREVAQRHQIRGAGLRLERELEYLVQSPGDAGQKRRFCARRELHADLIHSLRDELTRAVVVDIRFEFHGDLADHELRPRANAPDGRQALQCRFERNRNAGLELLGAHR